MLSAYKDIEVFFSGHKTKIQDMPWKSYIYGHPVSTESPVIQSKHVTSQTL